MMNQNHTINITMNEKEIDAIFGSRISELLGRVPHPGELPPLGAIVNNRLTGLYRKLTVDSVVTTVDYNSKHGADIYRRSACLMLYTAVKELYPEVIVEVGQSIKEGYFFELHNINVTKTVVFKNRKAGKRTGHARHPVFSGTGGGGRGFAMVRSRKCNLQSQLSVATAADECRSGFLAWIQRSGPWSFCS